MNEANAHPLIAGAYTVVISTYNRARYISEAIESLLQQSIRPERLVVISDGCTDDTAKVVRAIGSAVEFVEVRNGGKARALNLILPSINTEFCWFFDDDDLAYPLAAQQLVSALMDDDGAAFAFGSWDLAWSESSLADAPHQPVPYALAGKSQREQAWQLYRECTVMMTGAMLRTRCVRAVGGLDESLLRGQDYDLIVKLAAQFGFTYCGSTVYRWRQHSGPRGGSARQHNSASRLGQWARASEPVGVFLRTQTSLESWSEHGTLDEPAGRRNALIRRIWALAPKQSIDHTIEDLKEALQIMPTTPLSSVELRLLRESCSHDFITYRHPLKLWRLLKLPRTKNSSEAVGAIAKGLWWLAHGDKDLSSQVATRACSIGLLVISQVLRASSRLGL